MTDPHRPHVDADTLDVLTYAIETLAILRGCWAPTGRPGDRPHPRHALALAWSISRQLDRHLHRLITDAYNAGCTWTQIRRCLDLQ